MQRQVACLAVLQMVIMPHFLEKGEEQKKLAGVVRSFEEVGRAQKE